MSTMGTGVKIHTSRSMASTINTSRNENLLHLTLPFSGTQMVDDGILMSTNGTLTANNSTQMFSGDTLTSADGTLTVGGTTQKVDGNTLTAVMAPYGW
jgi:hypothetical protein